MLLDSKVESGLILADLNIIDLIALSFLTSQILDGCMITRFKRFHHVIPFADMLFNLKFASKEMLRESKKCEKAEKEEKNKLKKVKSGLSFTFTFEAQHTHTHTHTQTPQCLPKWRSAEQLRD